MTFRLVGLMSLVLLLSLAAFALLTQSYQEEVMAGVTRTISEASRATLRTFDYRFGMTADDHEVIVDRMAQDHAGDLEFRARRDGPTIREMAHFSPGVEGFSMVIVTGAGGLPSMLHEQGTCEETADECLHSSLNGLLQVRAMLRDGVPMEHALDRGENSFFIEVDKVRAEAHPGEATVLRIPTLHSAGTWVAASDAEDELRLAFGDDADAPGALPLRAAMGEILLPIETDEFHDLFASFRQRTLLMFVGVFLLGMVLSTSLATRFTRPVRRLDAGIRRLTAGELDVEVEAHGRDEIGRLGRAFNEMTRRLRASKERERELIRKEKLSALGRLAAGVAHDVRNPLHSIGLTLQNLRETCRPEGEGKAREFSRLLDVSRAEIQRLDRLVGNFLRFARSDRRSRETIDLVQLLRETAALVEKEAERRRIRVEIVTDGDVKPFAADAESIRSSILNLVMNSFEAMADGGTLSMKVSGGPQEVVVEIADTGRGIPEEDQERVFEFAYTTREDGHGLGLAMVHQVVVEDHGGRVSLDSKPGQGTRVRMAFPLLPAGAGA